MKLRFRRWFNFVEHHVDHSHENAAPLRKVAVAAVVENPYAGQQVEDLRPMIAASEELGREMGKVLVERLVLTQFRAWQGWHCRACGRAGTCQCPPDDGLREPPPRACRRRQGLDFLIHEAGGPWRSDRCSAGVQGRAVRSIALRWHDGRAAGCSVAGRDRCYLLRRQSRKD